MFELFYDGSNVVITIKSAFMALFKFVVFENGASSGNMLQPIYKFIGEESLHNKDIIEQIKELLC